MRSVFHKGPLVSIAPEMLELFLFRACLMQKKIKKYSRKAMIQYQSSRNSEEWQSGNFALEGRLEMLCR